jgi:hypothetical protein
MRNLLDRFPRALPALAIMFFAACASGGSSDTATTPSAGAAQPAAGITLRVINSHSSAHLFQEAAGLAVLPESPMGPDSDHAVDA